MKKIIHNIVEVLNKNKPATVATLYAVVIGLYLLTGNPMSSLALGLVFTYGIFRKILSPVYFQTKFLIAIVSLLAYVGLLQIVLYSTWLVFPSLNILAAPLVVQFLTGLGFFLTLSRKTPTINFIKLNDIAALLSAFLLIFIMSIIPLYFAKNIDRGNILNLVNKHVDDSAHISFLNDRLHFKNVVHSDSQVQIVETRLKNTGYPLGWHSTNSILILSIKPSIKIGYESVYAYVISKFFWTGILVYLMGACASYLINPSKIKNKWSLATWVFMSTLFFGLWFIADFVLIGFYNFIGILAIIPPFMLATAQLFNAKNADDKLWGLVLPISLAAIVSLSWLLVAPAFIVATIIIFLRVFTVKDVRSLIKARTYSSLVFVFIISLLLALSLYTQMRLTQGSTASTGGLVGTLNLQGGTPVYPINFFLILMLGLLPLIFSFAKIKESSKRTVESVIIFIFVSLVLVLFIYLIQMYSVQSLSYYFYKSLAIVFVPIIILVIAGTSYFVQTSKLPPSTILPTLASFLLFSGLVLYFNPMFINYIRVAQSTTPAATRHIQDLLIKSQSPETYKSKNLTVFATAGESNIDPDVAVMMIRSNKPYNACSHELLLLLRGVSPKELTSNDLNSLNCNDYQITILAEPGDTEHILEIVRASNMHSQINVTPLQ